MFRHYEYWEGLVPANAYVLYIKFLDRVTFPQNFANSAFYSTSASAGSPVFKMQKNDLVVPLLASLTFSTSREGIVTGMSDIVVFEIGDTLAITAPSSPDANLKNISFGLRGEIIR